MLAYGLVLYKFAVDAEYCNVEVGCRLCVDVAGDLLACGNRIGGAYREVVGAGYADAVVAKVAVGMSFGVGNKSLHADGVGNVGAMQYWNHCAESVRDNLAMSYMSDSFAVYLVVYL